MRPKFGTGTCTSHIAKQMNQLDLYQLAAGRGLELSGLVSCGTKTDWFDVELDIRILGTCIDSNKV